MSKKTAFPQLIRPFLLCCVVVLCGLGTAFAQLNNFPDSNIMVYHYKNDPQTGKGVLVEKFEWLDLARWYSVVSRLPVQPLLSKTQRQQVPDATEKYIVIETDSHNETQRDIALSGDVMAVTTFHRSYKNFYDVKELATYLGALKDVQASIPKPDASAQPLLRISYIDSTLPGKRLVWNIYDQAQVTMIEAALDKIPPVPELDDMRENPDFYKDGSFHIKKLVTGLPNMPDELQVGAHRVRYVDTRIEMLLLQDRLNLRGEIEGARKYIDLLKANGQPLRKRY